MLLRIQIRACTLLRPISTGFRLLTLQEALPGQIRRARKLLRSEHRLQRRLRARQSHRLRRRQASPTATATFTPTPIATPTATPTVQVTVQTTPAGLTFSVDGNSYSSTQTFSWARGSSHTISTISTQNGATGVRFVWSRWSDSSGLSHTVAPTTNTTYTAIIHDAILPDDGRRHRWHG
jgi:hypothetical protein